jgi:hypothetical protein
MAILRLKLATMRLRVPLILCAPYASTSIVRNEMQTDQRSEHCYALHVHGLRQRQHLSDSITTVRQLWCYKAACVIR